MLNQRRSARGSRRSLSPTAALHRFAYLLPRLSISERSETSGLAAADASSAARSDVPDGVHLGGLKIRVLGTSLG